MVFLLYETFCEGKNIVSTAALLGVFFKAYKYDVLMPFIRVFTAKNHYNFIQKLKFENFILFHVYLVYTDDKTPWNTFFEILYSKH